MVRHAWLRLFLAVMLLKTGEARAFDGGTHREMSKRAASKSTGLAAVLAVHTTEFPAGLNTPVESGLTIRELVGQGSVDEDDFPRFLAHFHDPTQSWTSAGLRLLGVPVGESSILWQQRTNQGPFASYSWFDARDAYFLALTETKRSDRDQQWANTFRTLGHLVHLIQDAAAPAHTRNDPHVIGDSDRFHVWAASAPALAVIDTGPVTPPDPSLLSVPPHPDALVAIAHLIDADPGARPIPERGLDIC